VLSKGDPVSTVMVRDGIHCRISRNWNQGQGPVLANRPNAERCQDQWLVYTIVP